ncbi:hypothetical protein GC163_05150 [bacterium]|nr:hypothetical protein [bacterium]
MGQLPKISDLHCDATRNEGFEEVAFRDAFEQHCVPVLRKSIVALFACDRESLDMSGDIYIVRGNPIREVATGTLVMHRHKGFLVTAAHALKNWERSGYEIRITVNDRPRRLAPVIQAVEMDESLDIAVVVLTNQGYEALGTGNFLNENNISRGDCLQEGCYIIPGFLAHECGFSEDNQSFRLANLSNSWARPLTVRVENESWFQPEFGWLQYPITPSFDTKTLHIEKSLSTVQGLSGANVWFVHHRDMDLKCWDENFLSAVGVQTSQFSGKEPYALRCTLWKFVWPMIEQLAS